MKMQNCEKTDPEIPLDIYENEKVGECPVEVEIYLSGPVWTPADATAERVQGEPPRDSFKNNREVRMYKRATKISDQ